MAPKRQQGSKAAPKLPQAGKRKKVQEDAGFIEKTFVEVTKKTSKSQKVATSMDTVVTRMIRDNFRGWSQAQLSSKVVEGMSLFERLKADRATKDKETPCMHSLFAVLCLHSLVAQVLLPCILL